MEIELETLTPLWTGGVDQTSDRLHETGLIGSLRWWYEALVRGLGGYACDPTGDDRCPDKDGSHCAACELFGCTGWGRKFRLRVLYENSQLINNALRHNKLFRLQFLELRPISEEEKWLLAKAIEIAANYGALGGKITSLRQTYGICKLKNQITVPYKNAEDLREWLKRSRHDINNEEWADLRNFVFVPAYALKDPRNLAKSVNSEFLLGRKKPERSRKIFVFKKVNRTFAYGRDSRMRDAIRQEILRELANADKSEIIKTGEDVLDEL